jgi:predicted membrane protein
MGSFLEDFFWSLAAISNLLGIPITCLFVFAFLYNLSSAINKSDNSRTQLSLIMMVSYTLSLYIDISQYSAHLQVLAFDVVTIAVIFIWRFCFVKVPPIAFYYLIAGLCINASLFLAMHIDNGINQNYKFWWLWGVYCLLMPFDELIMALVLIINKDILGLVKLKNILLNHKSKPVK